MCLDNENKIIETSALFDFVCLMMFKTSFNNMRGRRGRNRMVVGFTTTNAISAYHH
jgi:hypothetical protein